MCIYMFWFFFFFFFGGGGGGGGGLRNTVDSAAQYKHITCISIKMHCGVHMYTVVAWQASKIDLQCACTCT